jgi:hypothetical protein
VKTNKYIAYSLWGDKPIYNTGLLKNIHQAKELYPDWKVVVYHDNSVPQASVGMIKCTGAKLINMTGQGYGMFWRFHAADLPDCKYVVFRDCDSRLSFREKAAVDEWIASGKAIHIMRDHPYHKIPYGSDIMSILGGMWGIKSHLISMKEMIDTFSALNHLDYGSDQLFLKEIFLKFESDAKVHDELFSGSSFPVRRQGYRFVGERIDENDRPVGNDWKVLRDQLLAEQKKRKLTYFFRRFYDKLLS